MPADKFADLIISEMKSAIGQDGEKFTTDTPIKANKAIAKAITDYLVENTTYPIAYAGTIPGPTGVLPDPVVSDTLKITGECLAPGNSSNFSQWITDLDVKIRTGFLFDSGEVIQLTSPSPVPCFIPTLPPLLNYINLDTLKNISGKNIQKDVWTYLCDGIIKWLSDPLTSIHPTPYPGINSKVAGSTGVATIIKTVLL